MLAAMTTRDYPENYSVALLLIKNGADLDKKDNTPAGHFVGDNVTPGATFLEHFQPVITIKGRNFYDEREWNIQSDLRDALTDRNYQIPAKPRENIGYYFTLEVRYPLTRQDAIRIDEWNSPSPRRRLFNNGSEPNTPRTPLPPLSLDSSSPSSYPNDGQRMTIGQRSPFVV